MAAMTLQQMRKAISDNLTLAQVGPPSAERLTYLINQAKDEIVTRLEALDQHYFTVRDTYTVTVGDPYLDLTVGTGKLTYPLRRIVGATRTDQGTEQELNLIDTRERWKYSPPTTWPVAGYTTDWTVSGDTLYLEGTKLYFANNGGATVAMTVVVRYNPTIADFAVSDDAKYFGGATTAGACPIPGDWHGIIVDLATSMAIPANNVEFGKYRQRVAERISVMQIVSTQRIDATPMRIQWEG